MKSHQPGWTIHSISFPESLAGEGTGAPTFCLPHKGLRGSFCIRNIFTVGEDISQIPGLDSEVWFLAPSPYFCLDDPSSPTRPWRSDGPDSETVAVSRGGGADIGWEGSEVGEASLCPSLRAPRPSRGWPTAHMAPWPCLARSPPACRGSRETAAALSAREADNVQWQWAKNLCGPRLLPHRMCFWVLSLLSLSHTPPPSLRGHQAVLGLKTSGTRTTGALLQCTTSVPARLNPQLRLTRIPKVTLVLVNVEETALQGSKTAVLLKERISTRHHVIFPTVSVCRWLLRPRLALIAWQKFLRSEDSPGGAEALITRTYVMVQVHPGFYLLQLVWTGAQGPLANRCQPWPGRGWDRSSWAGSSCSLSRAFCSMFQYLFCSHFSKFWFFFYLTSPPPFFFFRKEAKLTKITLFPFSGLPPACVLFSFCYPVCDPLLWGHSFRYFIFPQALSLPYRPLLH